MADHNDAAQVVDLPVRYIRNPVSGKWAYVIELSSILGGCFRTREEAEAHAAGALAAMLERPHGVTDAHHEIGHLRVEIPPAGHRDHAIALVGTAQYFDGPLVKPTRQRLGAA